MIAFAFCWTEKLVNVYAECLSIISNIYCEYNIIKKFSIDKIFKFKRYAVFIIKFYIIVFLDVTVFWIVHLDHKNICVSNWDKILRNNWNILFDEEFKTNN